MKGITLVLEDSGKFLRLNIDTQEVEGNPDAKQLISLIKESEHGRLFVLEESLVKLANDVHKAKENNSHKQLDERVAERRDAEVKFKLTDSDMLAELSLLTACGGANPNYPQLLKMARAADIKRGLSRKRLKAALQQANSEPPGTHIKMIVAKGLPMRAGHSSKMLPLVPNALERILRPQEISVSRVDMRDLGDVICVKAGTPLLRRTPPSQGRTGFTVRGESLQPTPGEWLTLKPGSGTLISPDDENLLLAEIAGMPKFNNGDMWVDETFVCKGVNVGTGNINYDGAVIVNGDVTEKMIITASGDVTINGFVESAIIQAGGDIIITQGAMGKQAEVGKTEYSTKLSAQGSIHVQHGQGLEIICNGNVTVGKQLAHSSIICRGAVIVGPVDNPNGNLFGCEIQCQQAVQAGTIGAVSGSNLFVDFSEGYNFLLERIDAMEELLKHIQDNYIRHKTRIDVIKKKQLPNDLAKKVNMAVKLYKSEEELLGWVIKKVETLRKSKDEYLDTIGLLSSKKVHSGVVVKLNNRTWKADRDYSRGRVHYFEHQWHFQPT
ncbi:DUF342 domain-containing protein [Bowmanella sp. Y26]|uniref:DUF342 domain-containing protein n=1 Tax=Bowmanella yangjiangensis TaxID=2811230 RepID=UPI001BDD3C62|nr:FapA family protein [Bowmanella yangjiangensis]MBT1065168.1 DUF342 domain-containing protein [Bowmanella yangjiangensis]